MTEIQNKMVLTDGEEKSIKAIERLKQEAKDTIHVLALAKHIEKAFDFSNAKVLYRDLVNTIVGALDYFDVLSLFGSPGIREVIETEDGTPTTLINIMKKTNNGNNSRNLICFLAQLDQEFVKQNAEVIIDNVIDMENNVVTVLSGIKEAIETEEGDTPTLLIKAMKKCAEFNGGISIINFLSELDDDFVKKHASLIIENTPSKIVDELPGISGIKEAIETEEGDTPTLLIKAMKKCNEYHTGEYIIEFLLEFDPDFVKKHEKIIMKNTPEPRIDSVKKLFKVEEVVEKKDEKSEEAKAEAEKVHPFHKLHIDMIKILSGTSPVPDTNGETKKDSLTPSA